MSCMLCPTYTWNEINRLLSFTVCFEGWNWWSKSVTQARLGRNETTWRTFCKTRERIWAHNGGEINQKRRRAKTREVSKETAYGRNKNSGVLERVAGATENAREEKGWKRWEKKGKEKIEAAWLMIFCLNYITKIL